jgi:predicted thioesterase
LTAVVEHTVTERDTARHLGSGDVPVLGTPRLLALAEAATVAALAGHLAEGQTSVGIRVELDHLAATPVGGRLRVRAELAAVDGRTLRFAVEAVDVTLDDRDATEDRDAVHDRDAADDRDAVHDRDAADDRGATEDRGATVGRGIVWRAVVDRERFLSRL